MTERAVPPLPGKKPPVPLDFQLKNLFGGSSMFPTGLPPITGGAAGPATSGGVGEQGNIGPLTFGTVNFKSSNWLTFAVIGGIVLLGIKLWRK